MKKTFDPSQPLHPDPEIVHISLRELMPLEHIKLEMKASKRHEALSQMATLAHSMGTVTDRDSLLIALAERERMISTAQPGGMAFLHPRRRDSVLVKKSALFLGIAREGIPFESPDNKPTNLFFLLLLKSDPEHLRALSEITRFCRKPENVQSLLAAGSEQAIHDLLPN